MDREQMCKIYVEACNLGLMDKENNFQLRMNPVLIMGISDSTFLYKSNYYYGAGWATIIADATVGTYKIEKL